MKPGEKSGTLLVCNYVVDADDPILAFAVEWLRELDAKFDRVLVVTGRLGRHDLPGSVEIHSVSRDGKNGFWRRVFRFLAIVLDLLRKNRVDACFVHMNYRAVILAGPILRMRGVPVTLWYAHGTVNTGVRVAACLANSIVTASGLSFRLRSKKKVVLGHGIDTAKFAAPQPGGRTLGEFVIVSVSRLSPSKNIDRIVELAEHLAGERQFRNFRIEIYGTAPPGQERYEREIADQIESRQLSGRVKLCGPVLYEDVPAVYGKADLLVNFSTTGSVDKAVLEAMSCGVPVLTSNEAFADMLAPWANLLYLPELSLAEAATRIEKLAELSPGEREKTGRELRDVVVGEHDLKRLIGTLCEKFLNG